MIANSCITDLQSPKVKFLNKVCWGTIHCTLKMTSSGRLYNMQITFLLLEFSLSLANVLCSSIYMRSGSAIFVINKYAMGLISLFWCRGREIFISRCPQRMNMHDIMSALLSYSLIETVWYSFEIPDSNNRIQGTFCASCRMQRYNIQVYNLASKI